MSALTDAVEASGGTVLYTGETLQELSDILPEGVTDLIVIVDNRFPRSCWLLKDDTLYVSEHIRLEIVAAAKAKAP